MRKIRAGIVKKMEGAKLTNSELSIFLYLCQYQTDIGTVSGVYYKIFIAALDPIISDFIRQQDKLRLWLNHLMAVQITLMGIYRS